MRQGHLNMMIASEFAEDLEPGTTSIIGQDVFYSARQCQEVHLAVPMIGHGAAGLLLLKCNSIAKS